MVDHSILLTKLEVYRLDPSALAWFRCYLNDRNCSMLHLRVTHPQGPSHQGVHQGSILGPLLFVIFFEDQPLYLNTQVDLFADDTTLI